MSDLSPAEKLARIRYEELGFKEPWEDIEPEIRDDEMRIARRQIRALAEMEPTDMMRHRIVQFLPGEKFTPDDYAKAFILAIAEEGEK